MNVLGLVQLCSASSPSGGYAYCFGLESLARKHQLTDAQQLLSLVQGLLLAAIAPADGVASGIAYRAAREGHLEQLRDVSRAMSSDRLPVEMRLASLQMGARLWEISRHWEWAGSVHAQVDPLTREVDMHHAVAFGTLVAETTASQVRAIAAYLLNIAKSIIQTAAQAIPLDDQVALELVSSVQSTIAALANRCADKPAETIVAAGSTGGRASAMFQSLFPQGPAST